MITWIFLKKEYYLTPAKFIFSTNTPFHFMAHFNVYLSFQITFHPSPQLPRCSDCPVLPTSQLIRIHLVAKENI